MRKPIKAALIAGVAAASVLTAQTGTAAANQSCDAWQIAREQREEGRMWTASVCASRKDRDAHLEIVCSGGSLDVRYLPVIPDSMDPGDKARPFEFRTSTGRRRINLGFQGLDGAFAKDLPLRDPLFELIMSGDQLAIADRAGAVATQTYTLKGSRRAISMLMTRCRN